MHEICSFSEAGESHLIYWRLSDQTGVLCRGEAGKTLLMCKLIPVRPLLYSCGLNSLILYGAVVVRRKLVYVNVVQ